MQRDDESPPAAAVLAWLPRERTRSEPSRCRALTTAARRCPRELKGSCSSADFDGRGDHVGDLGIRSVLEVELQRLTQVV